MVGSSVTVSIKKPVIDDEVIEVEVPSRVDDEVIEVEVPSRVDDEVIEVEVPSRVTETKTRQKQDVPLQEGDERTEKAETGKCESLLIEE